MTSVTLRKVLVGAASVLAIGALVASGGARSSGGVDVKALASEIEHESDHVTAIELAEWIRVRKPGLRVIDVRSDSEFETYHIPSAERISLTQLPSLKPAGNETLVLYSEGGAHAAQGWVLLRASGHHDVYFLRGGILDWMEDVMSPALPETRDSTSAQRADLSHYFGGVPHIGAPGEKNSPLGAAQTVVKFKRRGC
jgi:rhodanese-related sulfurtransferase